MKKSGPYVGQVIYKVDRYYGISKYKCGLLDNGNGSIQESTYSHWHRGPLRARICAKNWARQANRKFRKQAKPYKPTRAERREDKYSEWSKA